MKGNPFIQLLIWCCQWRQLLSGLLLLAVVISTFGVSYAAFETRQLYGDLQDAGNESDRLDSEFEKLLLEQSAWAGYARIDEISREELDMRAPTKTQLVIVKQ